MVFKAAVSADLAWLAIIGVVASVVAAVYYLRIVKIIYFDEPVPEFDPSSDRSMKFMLIFGAVANSPFFYMFLAPLSQAAASAAGAFVF